jgi:hypothetical protein
MRSMLIPTGWIHAVFTPIDSIVIGGNFLHGFNIDGQLTINDIEAATNVPNKFRFPHYEQMQWYAAQSYFDRIQRGYSVCKFELNGLAKMAHFLVSLVVSLESLPEDRRERRKDKILPSTVKDPARFAQEFQLCITRIVTDRAREHLEKNQEVEDKTKKTVRLRISQRDLDEEITNSLFEAGYDPEFEEPKKDDGDSGSDSDFKEDDRITKEKEDDFEVKEEPLPIVKTVSKIKRSIAAEVPQSIESPKPPPPAALQNPPPKRLKYVSASLKEVCLDAVPKKAEPKKKKGLFSRLSSTIRKLKK